MLDMAGVREGGAGEELAPAGTGERLEDDHVLTLPGSAEDAQFPTQTGQAEKEQDQFLAGASRPLLLNGWAADCVNGDTASGSGVRDRAGGYGDVLSRQGALGRGEVVVASATSQVGKYFRLITNNLRSIRRFGAEFRRLTFWRLNFFCGTFWRRTFRRWDFGDVLFGAKPSNNHSAPERPTLNRWSPNQNAIGQNVLLKNLRSVNIIQ